MLVYGGLPFIILQHKFSDREHELFTYVKLYLQDEIRTELADRNISMFANFLRIAASESGRQVNYSKLSKEVGVSATTIVKYYQILEDTFMAFSISPITRSTSQRRLTKSSRYLFFDLGVRRVCAEEGDKPTLKVMGDLFEQFIGLQLYNLILLKDVRIKLRYWRDHAGPEVDFVLEFDGKYIPIEVKHKDIVTARDVRHLKTFMAEYDNAGVAYCVCTTRFAYASEGAENIKILPWQELHAIFDLLSG